MTWLIDIVLVLMVAIAGYIGYKKGVVKMLLSFLVVILALGISFGVSSPIASASYEWFFAQSVSQTVDAALENTTQSTLSQSVEEFLDSGTAVGGLGGLLGFDVSATIAQIENQTVEQVATVLKEDVIRPPMVLLLQCVIFILLFCILWIVFWLIARAVCHTAKLPVVRGVNAVIGGLVGLVIGLVLCAAFTLLLDFLIQLNPDGVLGITQEVKEHTVFYQLVSQTLQM